MYVPKYRPEQDQKTPKFNHQRHGFTLIEVMVALVILSLSLGVLLDGNVNAIASVERIEGITKATLLARGKILDLERKLHKEGFKMGSEEQTGNFSDEGFNDIEWRAKIEEIKVPPEQILALASSMMGGNDKNSGTAQTESPLAMLMPIIEPIAKGMSQNVRFLSLELSWPEGKKRQTMTVSTLIASKQVQQIQPNNDKASPTKETGQTGASSPNPFAPKGALGK